MVFFLLSNLNAQEEKMGKFLGAIKSSMPSWFYDSFLDLREDVEEMSQENKRLILFVHQDSCPYCHKFITKNLSDDTTKKKIKESFNIVQINMFGSKKIIDIDGNTYTEKEFAIKHKVQFTPTLMFFDENSKQILRLNGYVNTEKFKTALNYSKDKKEMSMSYKEYLLSVKQEKSNDSLNKTGDLFSKSNDYSRKNNSKKMAIFFESNNCKECDITHNTLLKDKYTRELFKKMDVYQVNLNSSDMITTPNNKVLSIQDWTQELNISHSPSIIFYDENAVEIIRIEALFKNFHFQSIVDYVVSNAYKEEKEFQQYLSNRVHKIREKGIDVDIWK
jgi:thioredoxin-related protein